MSSQLVDIFSQTLSADPAKIKAAEQALTTASTQPGFGISVLQVVASECPIEIRQAAAVNFKNHVKARWAPREDMDVAVLPDAEKDQIRALITDLMLSTPEIVRAQLSEALTLISAHDFPRRWPDLLPRLIARLTAAQDAAAAHGVLATLNSVFKRLRGIVLDPSTNEELEKSQPLVQPLLIALQRLTAQAIEQASGQDATSLRQTLASIRLALRVFFSLNSPGMTEDFENTLKDWFSLFHTLLTLEAPQVAESDPDRESPLDAVRAAVCANLNLYMAMNEEEVKDYLQRFVEDVWRLLLGVRQVQGQDNLAMEAIHFLTTIAAGVHHSLFANAEVLRQVCEQIVVPNLRIRSDVEEMFELNWVEYVRRDAEGSDSDTRRRAACELVQRLTEKYPEQVSGLFTGYVASMLQEYAKDPAGKWQAKDCAMFLVLALAVTGKTAAAGATTTNQFVDVQQFLNQQVLPELQSPEVDSQPILKADALNVFITFRTRVPKETCLKVFGYLVNLLGSRSNVVHSYAAIAVERLLASKEGGVPRFQTAELAPLLEPLLGRLFAVFSLPDSGENEYAMKAVMRIISFVGPQIAPAVPACLSALAGERGIIMRVCQNPRQPAFNHYMFESVAALVRQGCASDPAMAVQLEKLLLPPFEFVLQQDVQEFHPYVFQIFAQLIDLHPGALPDSLLAMLQGLVAPLFWERAGNVPALVRLLQAYLRKAPSEIRQRNLVQPMLGVCQKLVASKAQDHDGLALLSAMVVHRQDLELTKSMPIVWQVLLARLQTASTSKYQRGFVAFLGLCLALEGPMAVGQTLDQVQPGLLLLLLQQVVAPNLKAGFFSDTQQRAVEFGLAKALAEYAALQAPEQAQLSASLLAQLVALLEGRRIPVSGAAEEGADGDEYAGYSAAYSPLHNAAPAKEDPLASLGSPKQFLARSLAGARMQSLIGQPNIPAEAKQQLINYCQAAGVSLA